MKVRFNRQEMAEALAVVCGVASARTPKPILQCVHVEVAADVIMLSATDLEIGIRHAVTQVETDKQGDTVVNAETLAKIVRESPDEILTMSIEGNSLKLQGVGSQFHIHAQDAEAFPPVGNMEGEPHFVFEHDMLRRLMEWTVFAAARESTRYAINGILWEISGDRISMVATDGRRLSLARGRTASAGEKQATSVIVPAKAMSLFARLPSSGDSRVGVQASANQLMIKAGRAVIGTSLVEGSFPRYQDVIPTDNDRSAKIGTPEFLSALKRAALLTDEESKGVRFAFTPGELTLSSRAPEQGDATISMPVAYKGEPMNIGFNPVFLLDVMRVIHDKEFEFAFKDPNRPGVVRTEEEFLYVIMPVNL